MRAMLSIDGGLGLLTDVRLSATLVAVVLVLFVRVCVSLGLTLAVRARPRGAGPCGSRVEDMRFSPTSVAAAFGATDAADGAVPVSFASASALASPPLDVSRACDLTEGALPSPPAPYVEVGLVSLDGGGMARLSVSSIALRGSSVTELATLCVMSVSSSSRIVSLSSPDAFRVDCGSRLLLFACFDVAPFPLGSPRFRLSIGPSIMETGRLLPSTPGLPRVEGRRLGDAIVRTVQRSSRLDSCSISH